MHEIKNLATLQGLTALFVGIFTFLLGVWISCDQALEMAGKGTVDAATIAKWSAIGDIACYAAIGAGVLAALFLLLNGLTVFGIYREHDHEK